MVLKNNFVSTDRRYKDDDEFKNDFTNFLLVQTRKVRGGETVPVLCPFSISDMHRPAWPKELKESLRAKANVQENGNIRHVIRNFTLKKALQVYCNNTNTAAIFQLAEQLGVSVEHPLAFDACVRMIYKKLYLNFDNLWIGDALVNQMIGFLATPLSDYGQAIYSGEKPLDLEELINILYSSTRLVRGNYERKLDIIWEIFDVIKQFADYVIKNPEYNFLFEVGHFIDDIGLNLGFNLIDDQSNDIPARQLMLLETETRLQQYILSEGQEDDLLDIISPFLHINRPLIQPENLETGEEEEEIEEFIPEPAAPEEYTEVECDLKNNNELALARINNCLIFAIANALNIELAEEQVLNIRMTLNNNGDAPMGEMLDATNSNTRSTILQFLNLNYYDYVFRILDASQNRIYIFPPNGNISHQVQYIDLIYYGDHFSNANTNFDGMETVEVLPEE